MRAAWLRQDSPKDAKPGISVLPAKGAVDARFRSPRATVRTFLIAMNLSEENPERLAEALACLDLAALPGPVRDGGRLAFELEYVLSSINIPTYIIPDALDSAEYVVGEGKEISVKLRKMPDGRWLFDAQTLAGLPKARLQIWERAVAAPAVKDAVDVAADYRSPSATFQTFMEALKRDDLDKAAQCLDLTEIPDPARPILGRELALKLKAVVDRNVYILFQDIPDTSAGVPLEAVVHPQGRITAERQPTGNRKGQWLFNKATVRTLDRLYDAFESKPLVPELVTFGVHGAAPTLRQTPGLWLRGRVPSVLRNRVELPGVGALEVYQLIGAALILTLAVPVYRGVSALAARLLAKLSAWRSVSTEARDLRAFARPIGWTAVLGLLVEGVALLDLRTADSGKLLSILVPLFYVALGIAAYLAIEPTARLIAGPALTRSNATTFASMGYPVLTLVLKILVVTCGVAALLNLFEFDVGTVVAGLGIGGLAFALAAQDTLKNFFGSLMLIADKTFRVGDLVQIGSNEGVVESVGLRTTRIRGLDDSLLTIPNSDLTTSHVTNFGARRFRRFQMQLTIPFNTPRDRITAFRDGILELFERHPSLGRHMHEVAMNNIGNNGIELFVQTFLNVSDQHAELKARDGLILELIGLADRLNIAPLAISK
jgi:MscS family membrane protein